MSSNYNDCINCTVTKCMHIASDGSHCSLESISVGTHESNPTMCECTDCLSFSAK